MSDSTAPERPDLVFNAVYVPGTFRHLHPFLVSLLETSEVRVRMVANGCTPYEVSLMETLADQYPDRLEVFPLDDSQRREHGEVLNGLYHLDQSTGYFCFIDTDVMSLGAWYEPFVEAMAVSAAVSSAHPSWDPDPSAPPGEQGMRGHFVYSNEGWLFGSSYLAIYERTALDDIRNRWNVSFRRELHADLDPPTRAQMERAGGPFTFYDTAKIVNSLLQLDGHRVEYLADAPLLHIGAMSVLDYMTSTPWQQWPENDDTRGIQDKCARTTAEVAINVAALLMELFDGVRPGYVPPITDPVVETWLAEHDPTIRELVRTHRRLP